MAWKGKPERCHLLGVANQQNVADQHGVVPGLALDGRELRELCELFGRVNQGQPTVLSQHQQEILLGQQNELTVAVPPTLPFALPILEVNAVFTALFLRVDAIALNSRCICSRQAASLTTPLLSLLNLPPHPPLHLPIQLRRQRSQ